MSEAFQLSDTLYTVYCYTFIDHHLMCSIAGAQSTQQVQQPPPSLPCNDVTCTLTTNTTVPLTHLPGSRHVVASPFNISSLSYVTTSTQSGWADLIVVTVEVVVLTVVVWDVLVVEQ